MTVVENRNDEIIFVRKSEWDELTAEVEELRDTVALLVALAHEHEDALTKLKGGARSLI